MKGRVVVFRVSAALADQAQLLGRLSEAPVGQGLEGPGQQRQQQGRNSSSSRVERDRGCGGIQRFRMEGRVIVRWVFAASADQPRLLSRLSGALLTDKGSRSSGCSSSSSSGSNGGNAKSSRSGSGGSSGSSSGAAVAMAATPKAAEAGAVAAVAAAAVAAAAASGATAAADGIDRVMPWPQHAVGASHAPGNIAFGGRDPVRPHGAQYCKTHYFCVWSH